MYLEFCGAKKFARGLRPSFASFRLAGRVIGDGGSSAGENKCGGRSHRGGKAAIRFCAICAGRRTARSAEQQTIRKTHARGLQTSGDELPARGTDYSTGDGSARFPAGGGGTLHGDGRPVWAELLPISGGNVPIAGA